MLKTIIFILLSTTTLAVKESMKSKLKRDIFESKECHSKLVEMYVPSSAPGYSLQSDEEMLEICPFLNESCCYKSNLEEIHDMMLDRAEKLQKFEMKFIYLVSTITNADKNIKNQFILKYADSLKAKNGSEDEEAEEDPKVTALKDNLKFVEDNESVIIDNLKVAIEYVTSVNSRYGCALCDRDNHFEFKNMKSKNPEIRIDMAQCKQILSNDKAMKVFTVDMHTGYLFEIIKVMTILRKGFSPSDTFLSSEELENMPLIIKKCSQGSNFSSDNQCQKVCMNFDFFNKDVFYGIERTIIAGSLMVNTFLKNEEEPSDSDMNKEYDLMIKEFVHPFYMIPKISQNKFYLETMPQYYSWNSGWNIMKHQINLKGSTISTPEVIDNIKKFMLKAIQNPGDLFQKNSSLSPLKITKVQVDLDSEFMASNEEERISIIGVLISSLVLVLNLI